MMMIAIAMMTTQVYALPATTVIMDSMVSEQTQNQNQKQVAGAAAGVVNDINGGAESTNTTHVETNERKIRYVNVSAPSLPATNGVHSAVAATPFGSVGVSTESQTSRCVASANAIIAGSHLIDDSEERYVEVLDDMRKASKPRWGIVTQVMKLVY